MPLSQETLELLLDKRYGKYRKGVTEEYIYQISKKPVYHDDRRHEEVEAEEEIEEVIDFASEAKKRLQASQEYFASIKHATAKDQTESYSALRQWVRESSAEDDERRALRALEVKEAAANAAAEAAVQADKDAEEMYKRMKIYGDVEYNEFDEEALEVLYHSEDEDEDDYDVPAQEEEHELEEEEEVEEVTDDAPVAEEEETLVSEDAPEAAEDVPAAVDAPEETLEESPAVTEEAPAVEEATPEAEEIEVIPESEEVAVAEESPVVEESPAAE